MNKLNLIAIICFSIFTLRSTAQKIGITGAIGNSTSSISASSGVDGTTKKKAMLGYHIGPVVDFKLSEPLHFQTGILFASKGYKINYSFDYLGIPLTSNYKVSIGFIEIPALINYQFGNMKIPLVMALGPVVGFGMFGKSKITSNDAGDDTTEEFNIKFGSNIDEIKKINVGILVKAGVVIKNTDISLFYNAGLSNLVNEEKLLINMFGISISQWLFNKDK